jgi:hypothetical protein
VAAVDDDVGSTTALAAKPGSSEFEEHAAIPTIKIASTRTSNAFLELIHSLP